MKRKHYGLSVLIVMILSIALVLGYGIYRTGNIKSTVRVSRPSPLPDIAIPGNKKLNRLKKLDASLFSLVNMKGEQVPVSLKIFGFEPVRMPTTTFSGKDEGYEEPIEFPYTLSLCFTSPRNSFCIIDETLYKQGSILPDDGKILKIEHDRVQILKKSEKKWIYLSRETE